jgi:enoyl-CoA hydratase/carnithine racemase
MSDGLVIERNGAGRMFCAGGDVGAFAAAGEGAARC